MLPHIYRCPLHYVNEALTETIKRAPSLISVRCCQNFDCWHACGGIDARKGPRLFKSWPMGAVSPLRLACPCGPLTGPLLSTLEAASQAALRHRLVNSTAPLPSVTGPVVRASGGAVRCCQNFYCWHACGRVGPCTPSGAVSIFSLACQRVGHSPEGGSRKGPRPSRSWPGVLSVQFAGMPLRPLAGTSSTLEAASQAALRHLLVNSTTPLPSVTGPAVRASGGAVRCCQNFYCWHACGMVDPARVWCCQYFSVWHANGWVTSPEGGPTGLPPPRADTLTDPVALGGWAGGGCIRGASWCCSGLHPGMPTGGTATQRTALAACLRYRRRPGAVARYTLFGRYVQAQTGAGPPGHERAPRHAEWPVRRLAP